MARNHGYNAQYADSQEKQNGPDDHRYSAGGPRKGIEAAFEKKNWIARKRTLMIMISTPGLRMILPSNCRVTMFLGSDRGSQERYGTQTFQFEVADLPENQSSHRLKHQDCNTHVCGGDDICIANQDLIISVDERGSVTAEVEIQPMNFPGEPLKGYKAVFTATRRQRPTRPSR